MTKPTTALVPENAVTDAPTTEKQTSWSARLCLVAYAGFLVASFCVLLGFKTPGGALSSVFGSVVSPAGIRGTAGMIDTNTWLSAKWDSSLLESYRSGRANVTVNIVSSLPDHALDDANLDSRQTYEDLFKAGKLRRVTERATLSFERHGLGWRLVGTTPDQFDAKARVEAYVSRASHGVLTFVNDGGVYDDQTPYSAERAFGNGFLGGALAVSFAFASLIVGFVLGLVKGSGWPALFGFVTGIAVLAGPSWLLHLVPGYVAPIAGSQPWGFLSAVQLFVGA